MLLLGPYQLLSVVTGHLRLDGGAMFGVVPRDVWERVAEPDGRNRVRLAMRSLLAVDAVRKRVILVDAGAGEDWAPRQAERFGLEPRPEALPTALAGLGLTANDVTDVVITHLHFDHSSGLIDRTAEPDRAAGLRYPRARHWIHERHWHHAHHPTQRDRASFRPDDLEALAACGALSPVAGETPSCPLEGVSWVITHGHTPYQLLPEFHSAEGGLLFVGDTIPTAAHLPLAWTMAYDLQPAVSLEEKQATYHRCQHEGLILAFPHDPRHAAVRLAWRKDRPVVTATLKL